MVVFPTFKIIICENQYISQKIRIFASSNFLITQYNEEVCSRNDWNNGSCVDGLR